MAYCANVIVWCFPATHLSYDQWGIRLERVVETGVEGAKKDIIHSQRKSRQDEYTRWHYPLEGMSHDDPWAYQMKHTILTRRADEPLS
jgi:hypothetical protein